MITGFILLDSFHGRPEIGSSKIRGRWVIKHWPGAEEYIPGKRYDVEIFQKTYWQQHATSSPAIKILDIADPDWTENQDMRKFVNLVDGITCPTQEIKKHLNRWAPDKKVKVIPDRVDIDKFGLKKTHKGDAKKAVWFGYSHNARVLTQTVSTLKHHGIKLTVVSEDFKYYISDLKERKLFDFVKWNEKTVNRDIMNSGDFALLPPHYTADGRLPYKAKFKSNNKEVIAWALGLPVAKNAEQIEWLINEEHRKQEAQEKWEHVKAHYDVRISVKDYLEFISEIIDG